MYDLHELDIDRKEIAIAVLVCLAVLVVCFGAGYLLGLRNAGKDVHNNGNGVGTVGEQLGQAVSHQQQITDGIKDAEHTSNAAAGTAQAIAESAHSIEAGVGEAAGLIDSSQQILGRIRNRGQANKAAD